MSNSGRQHTLSGLTGFLVEQILTESKQNLINLGYPEIIASLLVQKFGRNAFLVSRWMKEHSVRGGAESAPQDWWDREFSRYSSRGDLDVTDAVDLYDAARKGEEEYLRVKKTLGLNLSSDDEFDPKLIMRSMRAEAAELLFKEPFFYGTLIEDLMSKKLTDLRPYKNLPWQEAKDKYDEKRLFQQKAAVKEYGNGWRWIDAGRKCQLVGKLMKNCGSTGVMSMDPNRTMLTLFDPQGKPHVVVTYSPNEKRISGDESAASTAVKSEYHEYILDLAETLGAEFDVTRTKSGLLKLKAGLKNRLRNIEEVEDKDVGPRGFYRVELDTGEVYYTNTHTFFPASVIEELTSEFGSRSEALSSAFREVGFYEKKYNGVMSWYTMVTGEQPPGNSSGF
jgi:hypothetical protein